ncbi:hypothetical protein I545_3460 [Mycobacterium kansasii 662]|uniref:Uncharacterized protein n=2 Tax=Mycobacterium kansasii TaxID=1768 RepID=A0A1V3WUS7_MYCKA|nr:hypothetical protein I547_6093 [Mycobacterium kansasii 824]ETZ99064.1 hypothetical protein I547_6088 [Mycobacterium kansasii 824]EUA18045.1 hypothetical protein I545_3460 [Mycobacterium kansasii 662]OOK70714.1 hypothetical protein BZL30_6334 [Mycobacterium kansasii]OOK75020.1 hypothetical protein BZL29_4363 [Mycobacterium kansasii]
MVNCTSGIRPFASGVPMQYDADVNPRDKAAASAPLLHRMRS